MKTLPQRTDIEYGMIPYRQTRGGDENIPLEALALGLCMAVRPELSRTLLDLDRFEDLNVDDLRRTVRGLIIDVEGTLTGINGDFTPEVVEKLREIRAKMPACIFCNDQRRWPVFEQLSIPVARNLPDKPDPRGFDVALQMHLQPKKRTSGLIRPEDVAMVGDNYLTDGGCRQLGMQFIHVRRREGPEKSFSKITRLFGENIASMHHRLEKIRQKFFGKKHRPSDDGQSPNPLVKALYEKRHPSKPL
jgi:predicted HAD superfamily phosphohydrolase YqeG